jgi:gliding motility-associated-like protein
MIRSFKFFIILILLGFSDLFASHYMGGEITWQCLANGRYRFIMKLYRECNGVTYGNTENLTTNVPGFATIQMNLLPGANPKDGLDGLLDGKTDLSPDCWNGTMEIKCLPTPSMANTGAVEEWYFTSDAVYPAGVPLTGVPPVTGYIFSHTSCCRNPSHNVTNATSDSWFLRAIMYPYQGQPISPCFDNSPSFAEIPSTVITTGYPFQYNHLAADKELDSLAYEWAPALNGNLTTPVTYTPPYTYNSPLPGPGQNPLNVAATMNPYTGVISYTSYTSGAYVTVTKVTAYKCDIKVAEIFREMQIVLLNPLASNTAPQVPAVFVDTATGQMVNITTVCAGDVVDFNINALDLENLPSGMPQTITLTASGQDFGAGFTNASAGCPVTPCATLNPAPTLSSMFSAGTTFHWQTTCDHLAATNCLNITNIHNFVIKAADNFCPANGITVSTITVVVVNCTIEAPQFRCTEVHPNGDVTISWIPPPDPRNIFNSYHIYHSNSPTGPFTRIDSIFTYNTTSATYSGLSGNTANNYFFIKVRSGCPGKLRYTAHTSDTLQTILLNVQMNATSDCATLTWNPVHVPLLGSSSTFYHIFREYPIGTWSLWDSTQNLTAMDCVNACDDSVRYRIEILDTSGCKSVSSVDAGNFHDAGPPDLTVLDSVSVDQLAGRAILGWQPCTSPDVAKYIIYHFNGVWNIIDSVDIPTTSYVHIGSFPNIQSESYKIAAKDSCKKLSPMSPEHRTIYLKPIVLDACASKVHLDWSSYINFDPPLSHYRVWVSENSGPMTLLGTVVSDSAYDHTNVTTNSTYCYFIQAVDSAEQKFSSSNVQCVTIIKPNQPKYVFLRYATVVNNQNAEIGFFVDTTAYTSKYKLYRSEDGINYSLLSEIPPTNIYANIVYSDYTAVVKEKSYFYKVVVVDSCNLDVLTSNVGRTIYLEGQMDQYMANALAWNLYEDRAPLAYDIYREVESYEPYLKVYSLPMSSDNYIDDVQNYTESGGRFKYYIGAPLFDIFNGQFAFTDTSVSNEVVVIQEPRLYVPNAFTPGGLNPIFKPVGVYTEKESYYFIIYDRWGKKVFETNDYNQGWDGKVDGREADMGVYTYIVHITSAFNKPFDKRGMVMLVK